ncbi:MAG: hypothetical protein OZ921_08040, partial [Sorangiineae bacterium]|nr:hypothetical protein [Sorangiineae bacterium]
MKRLGRAQQPHGEYATVRDGEPLAGFPPGRSGAPVGPTPTGEGCSTAGGCATCPYMKMNSLDALLALLERLG